MEILGLAIVVVLILVATIFVVRFLMFKTPTEYRKGFISAELASNTLNAFLKTAAADCSQLTMTELLQDCAQAESICCLNCGDLDTSTHIESCEYVNLTATNIFSKTFDKWNMKYEFLAYTEINSPKIKIEEPCKADKKSKIFPIPISSATMYAKLDICG